MVKIFAMNCNETTVTLLDQPAHDAGILLRHTTRVTLVRNAQQNLQTARRAQRMALQTAVIAGVDPDAPMKLAIMDNEIAQGDFEANNEVSIELTDSEKTANSNAWRTFRERNSYLSKHRGQTYSLI